jgi:hypothetical protein
LVFMHVCIGLYRQRTCVVVGEHVVSLQELVRVHLGGVLCVYICVSVCVCVYVCECEEGSVVCGVSRAERVWNTEYREKTP